MENMILSETQKNKFLVLISQVLIEIRSLNREPSTKDKREKALKLADGFHNIPVLISGKKADHSRLLSEISMLENPYQQLALNIINLDN